MASKDLLLRVAKLSFVEGMKNNQIAEVLRKDNIIEATSNFSSVQGWIEEAGRWLLERNDRLTDMERHNAPERRLSRDLCSKFGLLEARVVPGGDHDSPGDYAMLLKSYGRVAAGYFDELVAQAEDDDKELNVSVSGGQSILDMVGSLDDRRRPNVRFYSDALIGRGCMTKESHIGSGSNATIAWSRSGRLKGHLFYGTVTPYNINPDTLTGLPPKEKLDYARKRILEQLAEVAQQPAIRGTLDDMNKHINVAIAGMGVARASDPDNDERNSYIRRATMTGMLSRFGVTPEVLAEEGAVGSISYCWFDKRGHGNPNWNFFLTSGYGSEHPGVEFYRNLVAQGRPVIVIAGTIKLPALLPAMKAKLFNVLITDALTATNLLKG